MPLNDDELKRLVKKCRNLMLGCLLVLLLQLVFLFMFHDAAEQYKQLPISNRQDIDLIKRVIGLNR